MKAIAVRGTKDVNLAHPAELWEMCSRLRKELDANPNVGDWMAVDEDDSFHHNNFSWGNARIRRKTFWSATLEERWRNLKYDHMSRQTGCWNCPKACHNVIQWPNRRRFSYKCYGKDTYHMASFQELDFTYEILPIAQDLGLDSYSTPQTIAFALELLEAGILTEKDFPGMPSDVRGRFYYLIHKMAFREGIGDILADGVSRAAERIGKGAEKFDHNTVKKFEQLPIKLGKLNPAYFLMIATGEDMAITQIEGSFPQDPITDPELKEDSSKSGSRFRTRSSWSGSGSGKSVISCPTRPWSPSLIGMSACTTWMIPWGFADSCPPSEASLAAPRDITYGTCRSSSPTRPG